MTTKLTIKQQHFAEEYVIHGDASAAYRVAYNSGNMSEETIRRKAYDVKNNGNVTARINELQKEASKKAEIKVVDVLKMWREIATADLNDLVQIRRVACSSCHSTNEDTGQAPKPDCSSCRGEGIEHIHIADTRKLKGGAKLLYGGARKTKNGIEVIIRDQNVALTNIAKFLGMFDGRAEVEKSDDVLFSMIGKTTDPNEAAAIYQQIMRGSRK